MAVAEMNIQDILKRFAVVRLRISSMTNRASKPRFATPTQLGNAETADSPQADGEYWTMVDPKALRPVTTVQHEFSRELNQIGLTIPFMEGARFVNKSMVADLLKKFAALHTQLQEKVNALDFTALRNQAQSRLPPEIQDRFPSNADAFRGRFAVSWSVFYLTPDAETPAAAAGMVQDMHDVLLNVDAALTAELHELLLAGRDALDADKVKFHECTLRTNITDWADRFPERNMTNNLVLTKFVVKTINAIEPLDMESIRKDPEVRRVWRGTFEVLATEANNLIAPVRTVVL